MGSVNKAIIMGRVGRAPEIRYTQDGKAIANVSVATSESWKDQSGQKQERTEWHRVCVFGKLAEVVEKHLGKGQEVYFEGKIQTRDWTDKDGVKKYTTEVVVDGFTGVMQMIGGKPSGAPDKHMQDKANAYQTEPKSEPFDDEIPF